MTPAWHEDFGRRNLIEATNSLLNGGFVNFDENYAHTVDDAKLSMLTAHSVAGLNRYVVANWIVTEKKLKKKRRRAHLLRLSDLPS